MSPSLPAPLPGGPRKKAAAFGVRTWLAVDVSGATRMLEAGKHAIMRRTGLPARDLRILDPLLSYPSTVLGRERAVVVNLEYVKAIVTAQEVLVLNARDPSVQPFVHELQRRLQRWHASLEQPGGRNGGTEDGDWSNGSRTVMDMESQLPPRRSSPFNRSGGLQGVDALDNQEGKNSSSMKALPFEFVALETCLEAACSSLENETLTLEQEAHPALDKLTSKISTLNLECVRQIKSRLVDITGRVQKVRDELEHLLDDDEDMAEMYLTDKLQNKGLDDDSSTQSYNVMRETIDQADQGSPAPSSSEGDDVHSICIDGIPGADSDHGHIMSRSQPFGYARTYSISTGRSGSKHFDVDELEMLLEAYFVQIDGTLNKLSTLREYVDDTEDYINIMLDDKQNHLLQMGVMLTTATLVVSAFVVLVGIFGMNIKVDLFDEKKSGMTEFLWTVGGGAAGSVFLYVVATAWCKHRRLLE